jgi:hypothetical protein
VELPHEQEIASDVLHPRWTARAAIPARTTASMEGSSGLQGVFGRIVWVVPGVAPGKLSSPFPAPFLALCLY